MNNGLTHSQRAADTVTRFCGSWAFIAIFAVFTVGWVAFQLIVPFDQYPYILLNLVFTVIELFQGPLIMMSENRIREERERDNTQEMHRKLDVILRELAGEKVKVVE